MKSKKQPNEINKKLEPTKVKLAKSQDSKSKITKTETPKSKDSKEIGLKSKTTNSGGLPPKDLTKVKTKPQPSKKMLITLGVLGTVALSVGGSIATASIMSNKDKEFTGNIIPDTHKRILTPERNKAKGDLDIYVSGLPSKIGTNVDHLATIVEIEKENIDHASTIEDIHWAFLAAKAHISNWRKEDNDNARLVSTKNALQIKNSDLLQEISDDGQVALS